MSTCNISVLALSDVSQVSAMDAVSTSQLPAANDMYGQFTLPSETTSYHITSLLMYRTLELDFGWEGSLRYLGYSVSRQEIK